MTEPYKTYDKELVRERIAFPDLVGELVGELRRAGSDFTCNCPFHDEQTGSFHVYKDHGYCYGGCGNFDIFSFWMAWHDVTFREALEALARKCGVQCTVGDGTVYSPKYKILDGPKRGSAEAREKPILPPMRRLRPEEKRALATLRGVSREAVEAADALGRLGFCEWPQWLGRDGAWRAGTDKSGCFVVSDAERWVVQFRRLDGGTFTMQNGGSVKALTKGSSKWPVGCAHIGDRRNVLLTEGGTDMLGAYHFLGGLGGLALLDDVAVVCMFGAGIAIAEDALEFFKGKRVRIMMDADLAKPGPKADPGTYCEQVREDGKVEKVPTFSPFDADGVPICPKGWKVASLVAAEKWSKQLTAAGAAVQVFSLYGLKMANGERVTDLNDLCRCNALTLSDPDLQDAFLSWKF